MKETILITGATGSMGREGLRQLYDHPCNYHIKILALPTKKDQQLLARYRKSDYITVHWGDLTNYTDVKKAVDGADIVLHLGALVSPVADHVPQLAWKINFGGTKNIVDAIREKPDCNSVRLLFTSTVAVTGNRPAPVHWGRVGDPVIPGPYSYYAISKIAAERYVMESGLKYWLVVRQTGMLHDRLLYSQDGIGYHQPLNNHMEWVTAEDSGRLLLNFCQASLPPSFWRKVYHIGGGKSARFTAYEFMDRLLKKTGLNIREIYEPNMFALRNFHGQYFLDSYQLEDLLHFRRQTIDQALNKVVRNLPAYFRTVRYLPGKLIKEIVIFQSRKNPITPLYWIRHNVREKINAYFGNRENWQQIGKWEDYKLVSNADYVILDHGYDETKASEKLDIADMKQAALFRGGRCLSEKMNPGNLYSPLTWQCNQGHTFTASPYLILKAGHWCPRCLAPPWNFDFQAAHNPFMAQVWYRDHLQSENRVYGRNIA
jgi:nucleoside-diphosphate-sugar epimerase